MLESFIHDHEYETKLSRYGQHHECCRSRHYYRNCCVPHSLPAGTGSGNGDVVFMREICTI